VLLPLLLTRNCFTYIVEERTWTYVNTYHVIAVSGKFRKLLVNRPCYSVQRKEHKPRRKKSECLQHTYGNRVKVWYCWETIRQMDIIQHSSHTATALRHCHVVVTIDSVWTGNRIYWTLTDPWIQVTIALSLIHTLCNSLERTLKSSQTSVSSLAVARQRLPTADFLLPLGRRNIPGLSYQFLTATAHNDWTAAILWLTDSPTNSLHSTK
jgi:hypothetical protein